VHLLKYDTSGRIVGDFRNSVSYMSVAFTGAWTAAPPAETDTSSPLTEDDRRALLRAARDTLNYYFAHAQAPTPEDISLELTPAMRSIRGAFVTLAKEGQLRGCIGEIYPVRPLYQSVMQNALRAALADPRFRPVTEDELPALHLEISALTPPHEVPSAEAIVLGRHGIVLSKGEHSAVYLPQVAPSQDWTLEETLSHLSRKARLPPDGWKEGAQFRVFEADVFEEDGA
jgi:AmmeMemoRadiSam system protein A